MQRIGCPSLKGELRGAVKVITLFLVTPGIITRVCYYSKELNILKLREKNDIDNQVPLEIDPGSTHFRIDL